MTIAHPASPPAPASDVRAPWGFWSTLAWGALAIGLGSLAQILAFIAALFHLDVPADLPDAAFDTYAAHGLVVGLAALAVMPAQLAVVWLAVRLARLPLADYLALARPSGRDLLVGLAVVLALLIAADLSALALGKPVVPPFVVTAYTTAREAGLGVMLLLVLGVVVAAPIVEEALFRGFMYRGLAASRVGVVGAVLIPVAVWTLLHQQYEPFYLAWVFVLGLAFGWLRWRTGSLLAPMLLHGVVNAASLAQTAYIVG